MLTGCGKERDPSLVGDWPAPKLELLAKETIVVARELQPADNAMRLQTYTIRPGGYVHFERILDNGAPMSPSTFQKVEVRTDFRLSDKQYREVLERLALLHPRSLPDQVQPKGCRHVYDAGSKAGAFFALSSKQIGMFDFQHTCTGDGAVAVQNLLVDLFARLERNHAKAMSAPNE